MTLENLVLPPQSEEILRLIELHRQLAEVNESELAQEGDTFSLAQPSPFRFVPSVASNGAASLIEGE